MSISSDAVTSPRSREVTPDWFLNVQKIISPKGIDSLVDLWECMFEKQAEAWNYDGKKFSGQLAQQLDQLLDLSRKSADDDSCTAELTNRVKGTDNHTLLGVIRALHLRIHLRDLDEAANAVEKPRVQQSAEESILETKLIVQAFLDYLRQHGVEAFSAFINETVIRLVSTVHPNETERNVNLMHYTNVLEKYIDWKKDFESIAHLDPSAPEYRIRREKLNQTRRAIKAEIEGVWQANQRRRDAIPVDSEARRLLERYRIIFRALPMFTKFVKGLAREAFWLYHASLHASDDKWREQFERFWHMEGQSRETKIKAVRKTFSALGVKLTPPRILNPIITFGSWKGGDRDGNPFVVASFSNQTFIEQKIFVLSHYITLTSALLDKLTTSSEQVPFSPELEQSLVQDRKKFPYITQNLKTWEPYRVKIRYMLEKLENTLRLVKSVQNSAGQTTRPLLGQTLPGPCGYNAASELKEDIDVVYHSLTMHGSKAQARSYVQDIHILVETFGLHMTAIDFRQTSDKNTVALVEYLKAMGRDEVERYGSMAEKDRQKFLLSLITDVSMELNPWIVPSLSKITRDTFDTFVIFSDAAVTDPRAVGKFIISMCSRVSDILTILVLMKLVGMLETDGKKITKCPFDVTGLFETVGDLKTAPGIVFDLLSIPLLRQYVCEHRGGKLTVMMGYSDSVRDGSSLASDAQIARTSLQLQAVEQLLNAEHSKGQIKLVFYRGRGDTIPRGFGGSTSKAIGAQLVTTQEEDHTEQNRFLRRYASISSTIDHLHLVYSAHLSRQVAPTVTNLERYQRYFDFFGRVSYVKWAALVQPSGCGDLYFSLLNKYSILPHLSRANFASRPVARDGVTYNIESIRAIPFTMFLAQMREFTNAYYGTGAAFEYGAKWLDNADGSTITALLRAYVDSLSADASTPAAVYEALLTNDTRVPHLNKLIKQAHDSHFGGKTFADIVELAKSTQLPPNFLPALKQYPNVFQGIDDVAALVMDMSASQTTTLEVLQEMYKKYPPFNYSIQNKETALIIRWKQIIDDYAEHASAEEKALLAETEEEASLAKKWVLSITKQSELQLKMLVRDFHSPELVLLHKIQAKLLKEYMSKYGNAKSQGLHPTKDQQELETHVQMSILAISEALGFAG